MQYKYESYYLDTPLIKGRVFDVFEPEEATKDVAVFIVHGGGWRAGNREAFHEIMEAFCNRGYYVASTDYRLNAKDAFEQISDVRAAYDRFVTYLKERNRPLKIAVYGESAGAHLASLVLCAKPGACGEENHFANDWVAPCLGMLQATPADFYHWEGMQPGIWGSMQDIAGVPFEAEPERYARLSLRNYIADDNPPLFFLEAGCESMFPSEYTLELAQQHRAMGICTHWKVYHRMEHGFFYELKRKAQIEAFEDICLFLEGKLETLSWGRGEDK
jgi:acetyl esterase/lipase